MPVPWFETWHCHQLLGFAAPGCLASEELLPLSINLQGELSDAPSGLQCILPSAQLCKGPMLP